MLFNKATNTQAYLKAGLMGFAGTGKTFTATDMAIGMVRLMREAGLERGKRPAMFLDTETGSDWVQPRFDAAEIELYTAKTRAFTDLVPAIEEVEKAGSILIIDSVTHFWREITESYAKKKNRQRGLEFQDWAWLKLQWGKFTDKFVNSQAHIIMCGRAGFEYDFFENDAGKKELEKTGIKMKAETDTGYEPSILILMEKHMDLESRAVFREAHILKDRSDRIDGKTFRNPKFADFKPHIDFLNIGGEQLGVDTTRTSEGIISPNERSQRAIENEQREIIIEKIGALFTAHGFSSQSRDGKSEILKRLKKYFETMSWKELEIMPFHKLKHGYNALHFELEGAPAYGSPDDPEWKSMIEAALAATRAELDEEIPKTDVKAPLAVATSAGE